MCIKRNKGHKVRVNALRVDASFPVIHKVGNISFFVLLKFDNKMNREIGHFNYIFITMTKYQGLTNVTHKSPICAR